MDGKADVAAEVPKESEEGELEEKKKAPVNDTKRKAKLHTQDDDTD